MAKNDPMGKLTLPVVQTAGLCKTFRDFWRRPKVEAVKDLNIEIRPGEIFGLLGPNGSGKSTTIKMMLGLLYPTRGRISIFGKAPTDVAVKARIGFLPEETYLYRFLVASETLDYFGRLFRLPAAARRERTERLLDMVGLKHEAKRPLGEYSKGMARRIGLAQALINDPEFLILDEPTSGLDPIGARQIKDVIRELGNRGKTILLSSHALSDVEDVCDRVTILYGGQQRAAGEIDTLLAKSDVTQFTTGNLSDDTVAQVRAMIQRLEKKDIVSVSHPRVRLEEFFLQIVREAQTAKVRTSGATGGTATPEFLSKATQSVTHDLVGSLVMAADRPVGQPVQPSAPPPREAEPSAAVLGQLLGTPEPSAAAPPPKAEERQAPAGPAGPRKKVGADDAVLDSLLGKPREDKGS
jgi:ABC-2 type transport system ATP-binding protein